MPDIYLPKIITTTLADVYLFYINIKNSFYNFFLFLPEAARFYPDPLLRKVDFELFKAYAVRDQFTVAVEESKELFSLSEDDFTYGEAVWTSINKIMQFIRPKPGAVFYDLGCGTGRICFFANIFYGLETYGIDLIPTFIHHARQISAKFNLSQLNFLQENWLDIDFTNADIIYIAGTCLDNKTLELLVKKFLGLKPGTIVISVTNNLASEKLLLLKQMRLPFSWGKAEVFILKTV